MQQLQNVIQSHHIAHHQPGSPRLSLHPAGSLTDTKINSPASQQPGSPDKIPELHYCDDNDLAFSLALARQMNYSPGPSLHSLHGELGDIIEDNIVLEDLAH